MQHVDFSMLQMFDQQQMFSEPVLTELGTLPSCGR